MEKVFNDKSWEMHIDNVEKYFKEDGGGIEELISDLNEAFMTEYQSLIHI